MRDLALAVREQIATQIDLYFRVGPYAVFLIQCECCPDMDGPGHPADWMNFEAVIGSWRISELGTEPLPIEDREAVRIGENDSMVVLFWINQNASEVYVTWYEGPLSGHGLRYKLRSNGDGVSLEDEELVWVA